MAQQLLKKMSAKSIIGNVGSLAMSVFYEDKLKDGKPVLKEDAPKNLDMFQILGVCDGIKTGTTDFGEWVSFEGVFKAVGLIPDENGEVDEYRSARAFLPAPADDLLKSALQENDSVELAFIVGIAPSNNAHHYEYTCKPLIKPQENDAIAALEMRLAQGQLAAPEKKDAPEIKDASKKAGK